MFRLCFYMSEVISSFKSLKAGSQVFVLLMLFLWVILHTMWSGTYSAGSVYVGLSKIGLCVFRELCPVSFLVVGESPSVLL